MSGMTAEADSVDPAGGRESPDVLTIESGIVLDAENENDGAMLSALNAAEEVIPTRYHELLSRLQEGDLRSGASSDLGEARQKLQRFDALWKWAEDLKVFLSGYVASTPEDEQHPFIDLGIHRSRDWLGSLLSGTFHAEQIEALLNSESFVSPQIRLADFKYLAKASVENSIKLAMDMAVDAFKGLDGTIQGLDPRLQSIVLSGRACALPAVRESIEDKLHKSGYDPTNSPEILFRGEYAKTATAIGACRAQRRYVRAPRAPEDGHRPPEELNGQCLMDLQMDNLFFYLPASYLTGSAHQELSITKFARHSPFRQAGRKVRGIIRSGPFLTPSREEAIYRDDGDRNGILQGRLVVDDIYEGRRNKNSSRDDGSQLNWGVRYEINHHRELSALLVRTKGAVHLSQLRPIYDVGTAAGEPDLVRQLEGKSLATLTKAGGQAFPFNIVGNPDASSRFLLTGDRMERLLCLGPGMTKQKPSLVEAWMTPEIRARDLPKDAEGKITLSLSSRQEDRHVEVLSFRPRPDDPEGSGKFHFEVFYRIIATTDGRVALTIGEEPPYWETEDVDEWLESSEGRILRHVMQPQTLEPPWWRDPFCGRH